MVSPLAGFLTSKVFPDTALTQLSSISIFLSEDRNSAVDLDVSGLFVVMLSLQVTPLKSAPALPHRRCEARHDQRSTCRRDLIHTRTHIVCRRGCAPRGPLPRRPPPEIR